MARYADVTFNPRGEGVVQDFDVQQVEPLDDGAKRVVVIAHVRRPDGQAAESRLVVTMRRQDHAWRITEIRGAP
jgi:hypothetical protein